MSAYPATIVDNLKGRVYGVNSFVAIGGLDDTNAAFEALGALVRDGLVEKEDTPAGPLYKLSWDARERACRPRGAHLTVVS